MTTSEQTDPRTETAPAQAGVLPDLAELTALANAFFRALPGEGPPGEIAQAAGAVAGLAPSAAGSPTVASPAALRPERLANIPAYSRPDEGSLAVPQGLPLALVSLPGPDQVAGAEGAPDTLASEAAPSLPAGSSFLQTVRQGSSAGPAGVLSQAAVPSDATGVAAQSGGIDPLATPAITPVPVTIAPATGAPGAGGPAPMPGPDELAAIPETLTGVMGFVAALPGTPTDEDPPVGHAGPVTTGRVVPEPVAATDLPVDSLRVTQPSAAGQPGFATEAPAHPAPVPTSDELAGIPITLTGLMGFVAEVPGLSETDIPQASPTAAVPAGLPLAPSVQDVSAGTEGYAGRATDPARSGHADGLARDVPTISIGVYEFRPEMLPSLEGTTATARPFDPYAIRRDFPILRERVNGRPLIWLDNGATTQKPQAVIDRISYFYEHENSNIHRAAHTLAARSTDAYEGAREKVRRFLNAGSAGEIVFVRGATEAINLVANTWGTANVGEGDEILVTHLEHHANIVPWQQLAQRTGAILKVAPVDDTGQVILSEFERLITPRTKITAMTQVSNALGTITPVAEMVEIAHRHGVTTLVDAAQSVLHMRVDVAALDTDFLVFSGHKMFAPTGIGVVYGKAAVWENTPPWQGGGNMIADVTFERTVYQPPPNRFEAGTGNIADAVGLGAAVDYLTAVGIENVTSYEHELLEYGTAGLLTIPGLRLIGTARNKAAVLSFVLAGHDTHEIGALLDKEGIAVRSGHHCAQPILRRFGVEATVRPSLAMYNTREELDCLVDAVRRIQAGGPARI